MTRAATYTRVSSNHQEEDGTSLATQQARCEAFCAERGYQVVLRLSDTHTGAEYREREGLSELRSAVRAGMVDVVVVYAIDRLSRNQAHLYIIAEEIDNAGARLEFVTEDFEDSAVGRFIRSAKAFAAEVEHEKIKERTTRGKMERVRSGKLLPTGRPLYGYQWRDEQRGQLDLRTEAAAIVQRIFEEYATGKSIRAITGDLTADGVPTPAGRGNRWQYTTIRNILLNPSYKGEAYGWGLRRAVRGSSQKFYPDLAISLPPGTIPPIVDAQIWDSAQERLALNQKRAIRNAREPEAALLRGGYAKCAYCGWTLSARPRSKGSIYEYVCGSTRASTKICERPTISARKLDSEVWALVRRIMLQPDAIEAELERLSNDDPTERERAQIARLVAEADRQHENVMRALSLADDADVTASLMASLNEISQRRRQLRDELTALETQQNVWTATQSDLRILRDWKGNVAANLDDLSYAEKRLLLDLIGFEVRLWKATHRPRYEVGIRLDTSVVISTTSRTDHNVVVELRWDDSKVAD